MARRKPDWSKYDKNGSYPLHVLVALSLDINPDDIDLAQDRDDPELKEFWDRLQIASKAIVSGELQPTVAR